VSVLVLFALSREAAPFRRRAAGRAAVGVTGVGAARCRAYLDGLSAPPGLVVAAGFCGALAAGLRVGDVVWADEVRDEAGNSWPCVGGGGGVRLLTASRVVGDPAEKAALGERYGAAVVDMESAAVAAWCAERGVPFACVRSVSDTAATALSPRLLRLLDGGDPSPLRAAVEVLRWPPLLPELLRLARDTARTARNLAEALSAGLDAVRSPASGRSLVTSGPPG
jgi:adenosylhomocysteine nucleosidase